MDIDVIDRKMFPRVMGIDTGTKDNGWCIIDSHTNAILWTGYSETGELIEWMWANDAEFDVCCIEAFASYGNVVGKYTIDSIFNWGRVYEASLGTGHVTVSVLRKNVLKTFCGKANAKDTDVHKRCLELWGRKGNGYGKTGKGVKSKPGPLYGTNGHIMSSLAVASAYIYGPPQNHYQTGVTEADKLQRQKKKMAKQAKNKLEAIKNNEAPPMPPGGIKL